MLLKDLGRKEVVFPLEYGHERIVKVMRDHGYEITNEHADFLWNQYSSNSSANWLNLDSYSDNEIFLRIKTVAFLEDLPFDEQELLIIKKGKN